MSACRRHYPGRFDGTDSLVPFHQHRPSPINRQVGSCIISFEACSAFTHVTTCRLTKSPYATLYTGGSGGFVVSTAAPIATGWSDPVPRRVFPPAVDQRLSRRTVNSLLSSSGHSRRTFRWCRRQKSIPHGASSSSPPFSGRKETCDSTLLRWLLPSRLRQRPRRPLC
jgi:hypothetical protein